MSNWLHRLFNPHCEFCKLDTECVNCDMLRQLLADERENSKRLLSAVLHDDTKPSEPPADDVRPVNISKNAVPWRVRREMLETEDRQKAKLERQAREDNQPIRTVSIEELEKELGVVDANEIGKTEEIYAGNSSRDEADEGNRSVS